MTIHFNICSKADLTTRNVRTKYFVQEIFKICNFVSHEICTKLYFAKSKFRASRNFALKKLAANFFKMKLKKLFKIEKNCASHKIFNYKNLNIKFFPFLNSMRKVWIMYLCANISC